MKGKGPGTVAGTVIFAVPTLTPSRNASSCHVPPIAGPAVAQWNVRDQVSGSFGKGRLPSVIKVSGPAGTPVFSSIHTGVVSPGKFGFGRIANGTGTPRSTNTNGNEIAIFSSPICEENTHLFPSNGGT